MQSGFLAEQIQRRIAGDRHHQAVGDHPVSPGFLQNFMTHPPLFCPLAVHDSDLAGKVIIQRGLHLAVAARFYQDKRIFQAVGRHAFCGCADQVELLCQPLDQGGRILGAVAADQALQQALRGGKSRFDAVHILRHSQDVKTARRLPEIGAGGLGQGLLFFFAPGFAGDVVANLLKMAVQKRGFRGTALRFEDDGLQEQRLAGGIFRQR